MKIRSNEHFADISSINSSKGIITTEPKQINETFHIFYSNLYKSELQPEQNRCNDFLKKLQLPRLATNVSILLDNQISLEELKEAVLALQRNKSPGLDGIPP